MTRFARVNGTGASSKLPHDATPWQNLKAKPSTSGEGSSTRHQDSKVTKKAHKVKGHSMFQIETPLTKRLKEMSQGGDDLSFEQKADLTDMIKKDERREHRRVKRLDDKDQKKVCYNCRKQGHSIADCPKVNPMENAVDICFKCGSTEHTLAGCHVKLAPGVFPYAKCFICNETGHLSRQCPDNPRGLFPKGGGCNECGSVEHYRKDCPDLQRKRGMPELHLERHDPWQSADAEPSLKKTHAKPKPKAPKVVKF